MNEKIVDRPVGIIGLGDLGSRLTTQELLRGNNVLAFDDNSSARYLANLAVDPSLDTSKVDVQLFSKASVEDILHRCRIVHWAVASRQLVSLETVPKDCTVVLHDSIMSNSIVALQDRADTSQFVIAHCLMNDKKRVLVSTEFGDFIAVKQHLVSIGLAPKDTTIEEHDTAMARSQGVFALLIELGIRDELDKGFAAGNLMPSAIELRAAMVNREANWTKQTIQSILGNPQLLPFVEDMKDLLTTMTSI